MEAKRYSKKIFFQLDFFWYILLLIFLISVDQFTKKIAFLKGETIIHSINIVISPTINYGIAFSLFETIEGNYYQLLLFMIFFVLLIFSAYTIIQYYYHKNVLGEFFVLAGGISNLFDRFYYGGVLDFFTIKILTISNFPVGNLADIFIFFGLLWMITQLKD